MAHRLMVMCLGGLAGTGAIACCDLDAGTEAEASAEGETVEVLAEEPDIAEAAESLH